MTTTVTIVEPVTTITVTEAGAASVTIVEPVTAVTVVEGVPTPATAEYLLDFSDADMSMYLALA